MRVVGGSASGRRLTAKVGPQVRPTSDLVRGALGNMVDALVGWEGALVADLCCGTGALGIEALSRGAAAVHFVDVHQGSIRATRENLGAVGFGGLDARSEPAVHVVRADVAGWAASSGDLALDVIVVDPPYAFEGWAGLLGALARPGLLHEHGVVVAESDRPLEDVVVAAGGWDVLRARRHGGTVVSVLAPHPGAP